jgi:uncharacterized membrane protein (UPF0127 family)
MMSGACDDGVYVYNKTKESFLAFRVKVADTIFGRLIGLIGKRKLNPDCGLWIYPANAIHTVGMLIKIDVVLIDKNFKVVGLRELLRPFRIVGPNFRAESLIELPAHTIFKSGTEIGDQLEIERYNRKVASAPQRQGAHISA